MIDALRTPEESFIDIPDFDWAPNYVDDLPGYEGLRMHLIDEGPPLAENVFLCLHGEPTWSFLYRKMIAVFLEAGGRVVAPDFFGFGRSDKPVDDAVYTFDFHRDALIALLEQRQLQSMTLVCQDWGGLIGLTLPMDMRDRFDRMIVMNTTLGTGDVPLPASFHAWRQYVRDNPDFNITSLMKRACPTLTERELAAYEAPFPDTRYCAGVRRFPAIVPAHPDDPGAAVSRRARDFLSSTWSGATFMAVGAQDPVLEEPVMRALHSMINGCSEPLVIDEAGHFAQEHGDVIAAKALEYFADL